MTGKELLYVEDALGHAQFMVTQAQSAAAALMDPMLKQQAQHIINENQKLFTHFLELI